MNIQRNIFAGLLIFLVFLTIPIYLDFIGINEAAVNKNIDKTLPEKTTPQQTIIPNYSSPEPGALNGILDQIIVSTDYYRMILSKSSGGSISFYQLVEKNDDFSNKYEGSYDSDHNYDDSLAVILVDNRDAVSSCSPCLLFNGYNPLWTYTGSIDSIHVPKGQSVEIFFSWYDENLGSANKKIILDGDGYSFKTFYEYDFVDQNNVEVAWNSGIRPTEVGNTDVFESHSRAYTQTGGVLESITQNDDNKINKVTYDSKTAWAGIRSKYFGVAVIPMNESDYVTLSSSPVEHFVYDGYDVFNEREISPVYTFSVGVENQLRSNGELSFDTYLGPLDVDHINLLDQNIDLMMNFGWSIIKPFSQFVLWSIKLLHNALGLNYGFVLILIALIMRVVMGPLTKKSAESSAKMQVVAPLQKKLQEKYKNNPQKLQQEMGKLWKEHGVNPLSGCLPMLLQWPILMAFFIVFRSTIEFRGQPFIFWIKDLSQPDYIFSLPFTIPLYGDGVAVLPIIMGLSMFLTMGITMQDNSQKTMMYFMNAFFILIFNSFPSGLTLYYTMFNLLSYQQQLSIKKKK